MRYEAASPRSNDWSGRFSAPAERCRRFTGWVLANVDPSAPLRVLDIGCGTGTQLFDLAGALPNARFTGVDISELNIDTAAQRARDLGVQDRIRFVACDYLRCPAAPQDLIISYSTLQLIEGDTDALFKKIAGDIVADGLLMNVMPYKCLYNGLLALVRQAFAVSRSHFADAAVFHAGKLLHGRDLSDDEIRERVPYMYQPLYRLDGPALHSRMSEDCGLQLITMIPEVHASLAQAKHRLAVFRRRSDRR